MVTIANDLVALHSSDPVTVYLSVVARMRHPSLDAVSSALYDERSLVRHHAMRRTLWVFTPEVARLAHASSTSLLVAAERKRLEQMLDASGVTANPTAWVDQARRDTLAALEELGPTPARRLGNAVPALRAPLRLAEGKSYAATVLAHTRVLLLLGFEGAIIRTRPTGSWISSEYAWAPMSSWLDGGVEGIEGSDATGELALRWLQAFGPGRTADLQWWTGWTAAATKRALALARAIEVDIDGASAWVAPDDLEAVRPPAPSVAFLPGLDPTTMGWKVRDWYLAPEHAAQIFDRNGNGGPTVWANGRIVGGWVQRKTGEIAYRLLTDVGRDQRLAIGEAAADLERLLGDVRFTVRFPAPLQRELA